MTDRKQFEAMLEALINEDTEQAKEIFHNIVVAKSREIYEELLSEDFEQEEAVEEEAEEEDAAVEEEMGEEEAAVEAFGEEDSEEEDEPSDDDVGGDATDDMIGDVDAYADGEEEMDDEEQTDRILDLEDALEELKAEFEQLMAGEEGDDMGDAGDMDAMGDMDTMGGDDDMDMMAKEEDELQTMMEYVNKVGGATYDKFGKMGDDGVNNKSVVAGKNDMGGTTANIAKSFSTDKGGTEGGLASPKAGDLTAGLGNIHNRKDSKAGKTAFTKKEPGHGAEKKGAAEKADNKTSMINGAPGRAK